jgi:hypothetical protein
MWWGSSDRPPQARQPLRLRTTYTTNFVRLPPDRAATSSEDGSHPRPPRAAHPPAHSRPARDKTAPRPAAPPACLLRTTPAPPLRRPRSRPRESCPTGPPAAAPPGQTGCAQAASLTVKNPGLSIKADHRHWPRRPRRHQHGTVGPGGKHCRYILIRIKPISDRPEGESLSGYTRCTRRLAALQPACSPALETSHSARVCDHSSLGMAS